MNIIQLIIEYRYTFLTNSCALQFNQWHHFFNNYKINQRKNINNLQAHKILKYGTCKWNGSHCSWKYYCKFDLDTTWSEPTIQCCCHRIQCVQAYLVMVTATATAQGIYTRPLPAFSEQVLQTKNESFGKFLSYYVWNS